MKTGIKTAKEQFEDHFRKVRASLVMYGGKPVAKIIIKYPEDGAGRLYAYVHWFGVEMGRGWAGGFGYDKGTAACANATQALPAALSRDHHTGGTPIHDKAEQAAYAVFREALSKDSVFDWDAALYKAGFEVHSVI